MNWNGGESRRERRAEVERVRRMRRVVEGVHLERRPVAVRRAGARPPGLREPGARAAAAAEEVDVLHVGARVSIDFLVRSM